MKTLVLSSMITFIALIFFTSFKSAALPEEGGYVYYAALHEAAYYNGNEIYSKHYDNKDWWADSHLNKIANARYNALDYPLQEAVENFIVKYANDEGFNVDYMNVTSGGIMALEFSPSSKNNTLNFNISGLTVKGIARLSGYLIVDALFKAEIINTTVTGTYDYYNGIVTLDNFSINFEANADIDLDIPVVGVIVDPILDYFVDDLVIDELPTQLDLVLNAQSGEIMGVKDFIPVGELIYQGHDYGVDIRDKLETSNLINDNFSISVGPIVVHEQYFDVTLGNTTYKRWTTGGKRVCVGLGCDL